MRVGPMTQTTTQTEFQGIGISREGRYAFSSTFGTGAQETGIYDIQTGFWQAPITAADAYTGHLDIGYGIETQHDPNDSSIRLQSLFAVPITSSVQAYNAGTQYLRPASTARQIAGAWHISLWGSGPGAANHWAVISPYNYVTATLGAWSDQGGGIYRATITDYPAGYGRGTFYKDLAVIETAADGLSYVKTYTKAASLAALAGASDMYFLDTGTDQLSIRAAGGADRASRMLVWCAPPATFCLYVARADGAASKFLCSTFTPGMLGSPSDYWGFPRVGLSPDGLLAVFSSRMGLIPNQGRVDVYCAEVPRA